MNRLYRCIKDWYHEEFPSDDMWEDIDEYVTFADLFDALDHYRDVYRCIFGNPAIGDSIVRERCFDELSKIMQVDYDYVYKQWLKAAQIKLGL